MSQNREIMQLDAGFAALHVTELLVQPHDSLTAILPALPRDWKNFSFQNIYLPGSFRVQGIVRDKHLVRLMVRSQKGGLCRLAIGSQGSFRQESVQHKGMYFEKMFRAGEVFVWDKVLLLSAETQQLFK